MEEQARIDEASLHVDDPRRPGLLYGVPPMEVLAMADEWADQAKDSRGYKMKSDGSVAIVGVASLPREMEDDFPEIRRKHIEVVKKEKYGDRLKSVVVHDDEPHPHLHFTVIPRKGERLDDIHEGLKAKNEAKKNKQKGKVQNIAYIGAMRELQDNFYEKVAMRSGLTRLGPARTRDTRQVWKAKQQNAEALAKKLKAIEDTKKVAASGYRAGVKKGVQEAQAQAIEIVAQAQKESQGVGKLVGRSSQWLARAKRRSKAEATKVKAEAQKRLRKRPRKP